MKCAVEFNDHCYEGKDVRYPARAEGVPRAEGTLAVESAQDSSWTWTNQSAAAVNLQLHLQKH